jgi:hypothetical protein
VLGTLWGLIRLVVGVGIVVFAHSSAIMTTRPATIHHAEPPAIT